MFWLKIAMFAAVGLLSIGPTRRYFGWKKSLSPPAAGDVQWVGRILLVEVFLVLATPAAAAAMARGIGT